MPGTKFLWIGIAVAMGALLVYTDFDLLPAPYELVLESETGPPVSGTGTAFSIGNGVWMTARHVVDACDAIVFIDGQTAVGLVDKTVHHPYADLSLLFSDVSALAIPIASTASGPDRHAEAYLFGFPGGHPRAFAAALVEARDLNRENPNERAFPILVWAEQSARSDYVDYGGLSGGPVIDQSGQVIGVSVGADPYLQRVLAAAPLLLNEMVSGRYLDEEQLQSVSEREAVRGLDDTTVGETETALRSQGRIRQLYCHVE